MPALPASLDEWLRWQQRQHTTSIDLGLERIRTVARRLQLLSPAHSILTVGGTNGKGSCVALLEALLHRRLRIGAYTSPHFTRYNERIRINGEEASDDELCAAFLEIERARGSTGLSFFEYGTLAALWLFRERQVEIALLEVGLGGRMDAVNVWDADVALITSIGIDHTEWLGNTRTAIAREKAGIMRPDRPVLCGDPAPPASLLDHAARLGAPLERLGVDFHALPRDEGTWRYLYRNCDWTLPQPTLLPGEVQLHNAALAITALRKLDLCEHEDAAEALPGARLTGRFEVLREGGTDIILDIAHNPDGAANLAHNLRCYRPGRPLQAVFSALRDKDIMQLLRPLRELFDGWHISEIRNERALALDALLDLAQEVQLPRVQAYPNLAAASRAAIRAAGADGTVVVFGSTFTVGEYLARPECADGASRPGNLRPVQDRAETEAGSKVFTGGF